MLRPPPPSVQNSYNNLVHSHAPVESYQMPVWNGNSNSRKGVIEAYREPNGKTYSTIFRPILSSTIYTYNHHYKYPTTTYEGMVFRNSVLLFKLKNLNFSFS